MPRTVSYKQHKQKLAKEANNPAAGSGQSTLDGHVGSKEAQATNGASDGAMDLGIGQETKVASETAQDPESMDET